MLGKENMVCRGRGRKKEEEDILKRQIFGVRRRSNTEKEDKILRRKGLICRGGEEEGKRNMRDIFGEGKLLITSNKKQNDSDLPLRNEKNRRLRFATSLH